MRKGLLIRYRWQDGRPIGHWPGRRWGRLWIQGQSSRDPRESQSLSGDLVGSGLVARGLSWDESSLLAFFLDAQPDLTPATSRPIPAGLSSPGIHRSPRTRVAEPSAGLSSAQVPLAHTQAHAERDVSPVRGGSARSPPASASSALRGAHRHGGAGERGAERPAMGPQAE